jgi:NosL
MFKFLIPLFIATIIISCSLKVEPKIDAGIDECENCSMIIQNVDHGAVAIDENEDLHTFCSPVCLLNHKGDLKTKAQAQFSEEYLFDHNTMVSIVANDAIIVHGDFHTAMGHGLLAFANQNEAEEFSSEVNGTLLDWIDLRAQYETPDLEYTLICNDIESENVLEVYRDQVVSLNLINETANAEEIKLKGYDLGFVVSANSSVKRNFIASKPGQGFVFVNSNGEELARLFVHGEHTEEAKLYK